jgi:DNA-directed RNA polymerase subunit N (RpoN/RPB10)
MIPIRCMTCGKPVAHLWEQYNNMVKKGTKPAAAMDKLGVERYCCRSLFLTHIELVERVGRFSK